MSIEIRILRGSDEINAGFNVFLRAMVGLPRHDVDATEITKEGRYLGAFDGDTVVGSADSYTSWLTVPGGRRVPHAAVTHVGVLPTHTRRRIVTAIAIGIATASAIEVTMAIAAIADVSAATAM